MSRTVRGFTLVEVMFVIMIIGALAAIAINITLKLQEQAHTNAIQSDLSAAYKAAVVFHTGDSNGEVTLDILKEHGYHPSNGVTLTVDNGFEGSLLLLAGHPGVKDTYRVDRTGKISKP